MTKNNIFVGKDYYNQGLFVVNIDNFMNENAFSVYLFDFINMWHGGLGHVSIGYFKKIQSFGLISRISSTCMNKCEICTEPKLTRKTYAPINRKTKLLELIHSDLQTITIGGKIMLPL